MDGDARQVELGPFLVLEDQHGLEERMVVAGPLGVEGLDDPLERDVTVAEGRDVELLDPVQQLTEGRVAGQVRTQDDGVDEEPDQIVQDLVAAPCHRGAQRDVRAGAVGVQGHGEGRLEHHEGRAAGGTGQPGELGVRGSGQFEGDGAAPMTGHGRAGPVEGQVQQVGAPRSASSQ